MIILYELEFDLDEFMWPRPAADRRRGIMTSHEHAAMLRAAAEEMRAEDHAGWPNACDAAADHIMALASKLDRMRSALHELHATVRGECPSLLNEDSGGNGQLAVEIEDLLQEPPQ